ncbi:MAG TPA: flagellar hook-basal body protein [Candidatus Baltobacteraceae bacterium]|jgi:flagellar basal body rod protein FlgG|nr:flagellar hook-basal body protein [Candidatus Baltobacteraceae bacterium]
MNVSLYQAAAALDANSRWQEVIAGNMASSSIPGFKKQELSMAAVRAGLMPSSGLNSSNLPQFFTIPKATASTSFLSGDSQVTSNKTDVAIDGSGFFTVRLPNGSTVLTRDGQFQITAKGQLVTKDGYTVLGQSGPGAAPGPIFLDLGNSAPMVISATGEVSQGSQTQGKLKITEFVKPTLLTQISGAYFMANDPNLQTRPSTSTLRQGFLEGSNTSPVTEMANMMTAMRSFEANQHIIQIQDERLGKTISDLGNPT